MTSIGFDLISDLNLTPLDNFNWEGKATSLYCIIAGNISDDLPTIRQTLLHLSNYYQGIFYTLGSMEYNNTNDVLKRTDEIHKLCRTVKNVAVMHHHVVIVDGIAVVGANGWYGNVVSTDPQIDELIEQHRNEDILYLKNTIEKLQKHIDVKKIVVVSNSVPSPNLYFGEHPPTIESQLNLSIALLSDSEAKVSHWAFGTYEKVVDIHISGINYINNGCFRRNPYWAKRIEVTL
jgi:hypothetical protein